MRIREKSLQFDDPPFARALFGSTAFAWVWLVLRVWLGYKWIEAAQRKIFNPAWTESGEALNGFWVKALGGTTGKPATGFDWYADFLQALVDGGHHVWFAKLVAFGELAIGIALILGLFTGIAALAGGFLNWNFMMAGTASTNPMLFLVAVLLVLAWKTAGYWGVDRLLLPAFGTPWRPGQVFARTMARASAS